MGSHYKKGIFQEKTASAIIGWRHKAKKNLQKKAQEGEDEGAGQIMSLRSQAAESMERDVPRDSVSSTTGNAWDLESRPLRREALDSGRLHLTIQHLNLTEKIHDTGLLDILRVLKSHQFLNDLFNS